MGSDKGARALEPEAVRSFWEWFRESAPALQTLTSEDDPLWSELESRLRALHPDMTFGLGSPDADRREFVISAGGSREAFPAVRALVSAAPELPHWTIVPFRPRREHPARVSVLGLNVSPGDVRFELRRESGRIGIVLYLPGYERSDHARYLAAAFDLLDAALGEVDVETKLGSIELRPLARGSGEMGALLAQLPASLDSMTSHIS